MSASRAMCGGSVAPAKVGATLFFFGILPESLNWTTEAADSFLIKVLYA